MLIRFNVKNFLSFNKRMDGKSEEFSMLAGRMRSKKEHIMDDGKLKLLKFAAVYGANASGKSNLVKALDFMKKTIERGLPEGHIDKYCKTNNENRLKPSYFEIEIQLNDKYYAYGFEVVLSKGTFLSEWLVELSSDSERILFNRDIQKSTYKFGGCLVTKGLSEKLNMYAEDIQDDDSVLFLTVMNQNKKNLYEKYKQATILQDVYSWVKNSLDINFPNEPISNYSYLADTENVEELCSMIAAFGTGITGFEMVDVPAEKVLSHLPKTIREKILKDLEKNIADAQRKKETYVQGVIMRSKKDFFVLSLKDDAIRCQTILFSHNREKALYELSEESDGTVRILDLIEILLSEEGKTFVIDELDRCLHPCLSRKYIDTFFALAEKKHIQLIVTTHESRLLDFDLLRRDEIWFVNKPKNGESNLYSLEEYNARFDQKIDKAYLEGRYGGVPVFSTVFPVEGA